MNGIPTHGQTYRHARHAANGPVEKEYWKRDSLLFCGCAISSYFLARYLQLGYELIVWACLAAMEYFLARKLLFELNWPRKGTCIATGILVVLFAASLILGYHVHTGDRYAGLIGDNYISAYSYADLVSFLFMLPGLYIVALCPVAILCRDVPTSPKSGHKILLGDVSWRRVLALTIIIFVAWIPYLITYWPGFIFGDSISNISQALGYSGYSNHHPVAYTLYLQFWLDIASKIGVGNTTGIGLSSIVQMLVMAAVFAYMVEWMVVRFGLRRIWYAILLAPYALTAYVATYGIALWKDPLFSVAIVIQTICIADFVWSKGGFVSHRRSWYLAYVLSGIVLVLFRNNGIFVFAASVAALVVMGLHWHMEISKPWSCVVSPAVSACIVVAVFVVFTGPVFSYLKVAPTEKAESVGVPLNQMARVVALDGDMSESDREYMNALFPIDEYKNAYRPCCTDLLKWDSRFNGEVLNENLWEHWTSMFKRNPRVYLEAWELQTFGFWAVNTGNISGFWSWNITGGVPRNNGDYAVPAEFDIQFGPYNTSSTLTNIFPEDEWSLPVSWILWGLLYLSLLLCCNHKAGWLAIVIPSLALIGTLVIASPIYYWPRYGAAAQFLAPFYLLLFFAQMTGDRNIKTLL